MTYASDKEILQACGLHEIDVAQILGKTRQAINIGLKAPHYFKPHELFVLYAYLLAHKSEQAEKFSGYCLASNPERRAALARMFDGVLNSDAAVMLARAPAAWIVLPEYNRLTTQTPEIVHTFAGAVAANPDRELVFFVPDELQANMLKLEVFGGKEPPPGRIRVVPLNGPFMTAIFINPTAPDGAGFVWTRRGFVELDRKDARANRTALFMLMQEQDRKPARASAGGPAAKPVPAP